MIRRLGGVPLADQNLSDEEILRRHYARYAREGRLPPELAALRRAAGDAPQGSEAMNGTGDAKPFNLADMANLVGQDLAVTDWLKIDQDMVNDFGRVTYWDTWMHCDRERSERESPYGGALLHGFHVVALITRFLRMSKSEPIDGDYFLYYGTDKVRILQPVVIGDGIRLRDRIRLLGVEHKENGSVRMTTGHEIECDRNDGPVAYAEFIGLWYAKSG